MPSEGISPYEPKRIAQPSAKGGCRLRTAQCIVDDRMIRANTAVMLGHLRGRPPIRPAVYRRANARRRSGILQTREEPFRLAEGMLWNTSALERLCRTRRCKQWTDRQESAL